MVGSSKLINSVRVQSFDELVELILELSSNVQPTLRESPRCRAGSAMRADRIGVQVLLGEAKQLFRPARRFLKSIRCGRGIKSMVDKPGERWSAVRLSSTCFFAYRRSRPDEPGCAERYRLRM